MRYFYFGANGNNKPLPPTDLVATFSAADNATYDYAWTDNAANNDGYDFGISVDGGAFSAFQLSPNAESFNSDLETRTTGTTIQFRVRAYSHTNGNSEWVYSDVYVTPGPVAPSGVSASHDSGTGDNTITWTDESTDESGFDVFASVNGGAMSLIYTENSGVTSYTDTATYNPGDSIVYGVRSIIVAGGNAGVSEIIEAASAVIIP